MSKSAQAQRAQEQPDISRVLQSLLLQFIVSGAVAGFIIWHHALLKTRPAELILVIALALAAGVGVMASKLHIHERQLYLSTIYHLVWITALGWFLPAPSPFLLVSILVLLNVAATLGREYIALSAAALITGNLLFFFRNNGFDSSDAQMALAVIILLAALGALTRTIMKPPKLHRIRNAHPAHHELEGEQLHSLINSMADAVIAVDEHGRVILYNGAALDLLDINATLDGELLSRYVHIINPKDHAVNLITQAEHARGRYISRDLRLKYADGETINLYVSASPVRVSYGKRGDRGFILILRDITKEKSLEEERNEFISVVSHELRTPVTITEGNISNAQLALKKKASPQVLTTMLDQAHDQVVFLAQMINDLSTLSRAERGKLLMEPTSIDPVALIDSLREAYHLDAERKGLQLKVTKLPKLKSIVSSELYVREILQNFITNAIKYTQKGSVTLSASQSADGVTFTVSDTGIGVSKSDQKKLFDKFFRSEDFRTRENSGTGLGLYVTQKLADILKANISLESELNKGSTFRITIPSIEPPLHNKVK